jgi:hypothetical protein
LIQPLIDMFSDSTLRHRYKQSNVIICKIVTIYLHRNWEFETNQEVKNEVKGVIQEEASSQMEEKDTHGMSNDLYTPHFISFCRLLNVIFSLSSVSPDVISSLTPLEFLECAFHCEVRIEIKCTYE